MDLITLLGSLLSLLDYGEYGLNAFIEDLYWRDDLDKYINVKEFDFNNKEDVNVLFNWLLYIVECLYRYNDDIGLDNDDIELNEEYVNELLIEIFTVFSYVVQNCVVDYTLIHTTKNIIDRVKSSLKSTYKSIHNGSIERKKYYSFYIDFLKNLLTMLIIHDEKQKMEKQFYICLSICISHFSELSEFWDSEILFISDMTKYVGSDFLETKVRMYVDQLVDVYNHNGDLEFNYRNRRNYYNDEPNFVL
jgi:hypothetical protein